VEIRVIPGTLHRLMSDKEAGMVSLTNLVRRRESPAGEVDAAFVGHRHDGITPGFEPLADALLYSGNLEACATEVGLRVATDGVALDQALDDLAATYFAVGAGQPGYRVVRALCLAWNEVSLQYLHGLSCSDPLTGLASLPHLRSRLDELYQSAQRDDERVDRTHVLVLVELGPPVDPAPSIGPTGDLSERFAELLCLVEVAEGLRTVFSCGETLASIGAHRAVALVVRHPDLGLTVESLRQLLVSWSRTTVRSAPRVWTESLPPRHELVTDLLDELAR